MTDSILHLKLSTRDQLILELWKEAFPAHSRRGDEKTMLDMVHLHTALINAELTHMRPFTEDEAFTLLQFTQGTVMNPLQVGGLLADDIDDDPDIEFSPVLAAKLQALSITQDWGVRWLLQRYSERRRSRTELTLRESGFPLEPLTSA